MKEQVMNLGYAMEALANEEALLTVRREVFNEENHELIESISGRKAIVDKYKNEIRPMAIEMFKELGVKKLIGGVGIRVSKDKTVYHYDADTALAFAKEKDMFLMLDTMAFEAAAPGMHEEFLTSSLEPGAVTVTFPKEVKVDE